MTTKVKLREKKISKERKSLYLDFYPPIPHPQTGEPTRREFLGLYIFEKPKNPFDKTHNKKTILIGESIRQKKENFLNKPEIYSTFEKEQLRIKELGEGCFIEYFRMLANKRKSSNYDNWISTLKYLVNYTDGSLKFYELNDSFLEGFKEYLLTTKSNKSRKKTLSQNSAVSYFNKVKAALKQAYKDGILQTDLNAKIQSIKADETRREHLNIEELNKLVITPCKNDLLKKSALFSALTGMAFQELKNMIWKDISFVPDEGYLVLTRRQKTEKDNYLPISDQAYNLLGKSGTENSYVFDGLKYSAYQNKLLHQWVETAGITKKITFHCFRHTYATLQLYKGTDLYTVSKMLGHENIKTTQIYAKIVDETKRKAANKIQLDME